MSAGYPSIKNSVGALQKLSMLLVMREHLLIAKKELLVRFLRRCEAVEVGRVLKTHVLVKERKIQFVERNK